MRNILNKILFTDYTKSLKKDTKSLIYTQITIFEYRYLLVNLLNNNLIIDKNAKILHNKIYELDYNNEIKFERNSNESYELTKINNERNYIKTELYDYIKFLIKYDYINNINNAITLLFSYLLKCYNEVFELLIIFNLIKKLDDLILNKKIYLCNKSDIILIYNIINEFKLFFNNLLIFNKEIINNDINLNLNTNNIYVLNKINFIIKNNLFYNKNGTINYDNFNKSKLFYKDNYYYILFINNIKDNEIQMLYLNIYIN